MSDSSVRVLHVDDDRRVLELSAAFLEHETDSITVRTATSASDAREQLSTDIDCVVTDYDMPGQNGIQFFQDVRARHPDLPVILFTSKSSAAVAQKALTVGMDGYLRKSGGGETYQSLVSEIHALVETVQLEERSEGD